MPSNPPSARALGEERCVRCGKPKSEHYDAITPNGDERFCYRIEEAGTLDRELARFVAPPSSPAARAPDEAMVRAAMAGATYDLVRAKAKELTELLVKLRTIQTYARMAIATRRVSEADAYDAATSPETMAEVLEQVLARLDPLFAEASPPTRADPRTP